MKTLAKILFVLTILISFYSCGSDTSEDPTPIATTITPVVTMSIEYDNNSYIVFTLDKKYDTPTVIEFNSNLKSLFSITIPSNTLSGKYYIGTTTTNSEYRISEINDIKIGTAISVTTQECVDPNLTKYLNSIVNKIEIIRIDGGVKYNFNTIKGDFSVIYIANVSNNEFLNEQTRLDKFIGKTILNIDDYTSTVKRINFMNMELYVKYNRI